jgi:hypothetical protein
MQATEIVAPIVLADVLEGSLYSLTGDVIGTCFSLGGRYCLTAGHVATEIGHRPVGKVAVIGFRIEGRWIGAEVVESEVLAADVGVLRFTFREGVEGSEPPRFSWSVRPLPLLAPVKAIGYPFGSDLVDNQLFINPRAFQGHVAGAPSKYRPVGFDGAAFAVYELSFAAPRGLSGAPLLVGEAPTVVAGVVIGNSQSVMRVHQSTEMISTAESKTTVENFEWLRLGVAVQSPEVASLHSALLGRTVIDHLHEHGLLR